MVIIEMSGDINLGLSLLRIFALKVDMNVIALRQVQDQVVLIVEAPVVFGQFWLKILSLEIVR